MIKKSIVLIIIIIIFFLIISYSVMIIFKKNKSENFYKNDFDIDNEDDNHIKYTKHNYIHSNRTRRPKQYYEKF